MKYYIIAGEASGDLHGSNLMKALRKKDQHAEFRFWGGDLMSAAGGTPVKHYRDLAFMGFLEVAKNIRTILNNIRFCKHDIRSYKPDVLILVDYPGFNLRIAKFAKTLGIKVVYYISPQLWAWKESRVEIIKKYVDEMLVILPFEEDFYKKHGVHSHFVGHPLLDAISNLENIDPKTFKKDNGLTDREIIALLPGSRKQEVEKMLELMLSVRPHFKDYQFVIAGAPSLPKEFYQKYVDDHVHFVSNKTYDLLRCSKAALVTSGTATLETALLNVPEVVCYRGSKISYAIAKRLVKNIKYISLVNLIMDREVVKELIQDDLNTPNLINELNQIISGEKRSVMLKDYELLREKLGGKGASDKAAEVIVNVIK
ncbi:MULTISPECIES: lipid-A-disaccharide synthase [Chryseobacterium]|uniref:Lipid-A-disaccharide synthase n=1 Tax=Chryseobacterium camelliae TaxID=1265445 RepID=A0ABU0TLT7_9FLAO|nr:MULTISPECIES: lipid-A-disaccharide synthase [Chryseobacterium]MDT3408387.1 lipid-A-disaccharide synthase [Pseudacidovorax intermedius]MDQ1097756.1 lipid-A-disaccharide synthase [Chryseobacterium camelliae]MDQ1101690.1 lipid-A-disaccharide synthase [Chryseobacterium sp. SORGH_AS_1048]MDR6085128.1 lipid-A-disaccharide synthase [Chryseobacterium sp. SORGH_AS_0909]MDR6129486.1 lipid-A-disaccharide synthase [Chryseobacterium sp. SORGH_AS_1175]